MYVSNYLLEKMMNCQGITNQQSMYEKSVALFIATHDKKKQEKDEQIRNKSIGFHHGC